MITDRVANKLILTRIIAMHIYISCTIIYYYSK